MTDATDACTLGTFDTTTSGVFVEAAMSPGLLRWYLVTAAAGIDEGPSGTGSFGPRALDSLGACGAGPRLLINEIDYDQPGTDGAEFVEVLNAGDAPADLAGLVLVFVNGLTSQEYARVTLDAAGPSLEPGAYLVIGPDGVLATLPAGTASIALPASANNIQNGAPDGVALFDPGALRVLDALAYEGAIHAAVFDGATGTFDLVEGTPATAVDSGTGDGSLARVPDGADSGNADVDWRFASTPTPGMANPTP